MTIRDAIRTVYERHGLSRARLAEVLRWSVEDVIEAEETDSIDDQNTAVLLRIMAWSDPAMVRAVLEEL